MLLLQLSETDSPADDEDCENTSESDMLPTPAPIRTYNHIVNRHKQLVTTSIIITESMKTHLLNMSFVEIL